MTDSQQAADARTSGVNGWVIVLLISVSATVGHAFGRFSYGVLLPAVRHYLAISNTPAAAICDSLCNNKTLKRIELGYTEKFASSFRRLTPERRLNRTNDILSMLNTNKTLQLINWPEFQQDESLMPDVERRLMENKNNAS